MRAPNIMAPKKGDPNLWKHPMETECPDLRYKVRGSTTQAPGRIQKVDPP